MDKKGFGGGMGMFSFSSFIKGFLVGAILLFALFFFKVIPIGFLCS